jgi:competence protein ComEA
VRRIDTAHVVVAVVVTAVALVGTVVVLGNAQPSREPVDVAAVTSSGPAPTNAPGWPTSVETPVAPRSDPTPPTLVVHVVGDVARPGVVRVPHGARVIDAIEAAGGADSDADVTTVNLARLVVDGEQVRVGLPPAPQLSAPGASVPGATGSSAMGLVDVNVASAAQLVELPGIGPVLAERIVTFRTENGPFRSLDQLVEVPGIGPAILDDLDGRVRL